MLPSAIIGGVIAAMVGVIGFAVTRQFVDGQDTSTWSAAERAIISDATFFANPFVNPSSF